jgi:hypothetical protein
MSGDVSPAPASGQLSTQLLLLLLLPLALLAASQSVLPMQSVLLLVLLLGCCHLAHMFAVVSFMPGPACACGTLWWAMGTGCSTSGSAGST